MSIFYSCESPICCENTFHILLSPTIAKFPFLINIVRVLGKRGPDVKEDRAWRIHRVDDKAIKKSTDVTNNLIARKSQIKSRSIVMGDWFLLTEGIKDSS